MDPVPEDCIYLSKWCRPWWNAAYCGISSGSSLFANYPLFVAVFLGYNQCWPGGFMVLWIFLCPGAPEGSTGSGSDFKASQKTGPQLKVLSDRLGEAGNGTCETWLQGIGLSPTPRLQSTPLGVSSTKGLQGHNIMGLIFKFWKYRMGLNEIVWMGLHLPVHSQCVHT